MCLFLESPPFPALYPTYIHFTSDTVTQSKYKSVEANLENSLF